MGLSFSIPRSYIGVLGGHVTLNDSCWWVDGIMRWRHQMKTFSYQEWEYQAVLTYLIDAMFSLSFPVHICTGSIMRLILALRTLTLWFVSQGIFPVRSKTYGDMITVYILYTGLPWCFSYVHIFTDWKYIWYRDFKDPLVLVRMLSWCYSGIRQKEKAVWKAFAK